jgi:hypothetical protein
MMDGLRSLGEWALQDQRSEVIYQGNAEFHRVQVHMVSKCAKIISSDGKWPSSSSDSQSYFSSTNAAEAKQFAPSLRQL